MTLRVRRPQTVFLTISAFGLVLFLFLNIMVNQLHVISVDQELFQQQRTLYGSNKILIPDKSDVRDNFEDLDDNLNILQGRRKPKATNMDGGQIESNVLEPSNSKNAEVNKAGFLLAKEVSSKKAAKVKGMNKAVKQNKSKLHEIKENGNHQYDHPYYDENNYYNNYGDKNNDDDDDDDDDDEDDGDDDEEYEIIDEDDDDDNDQDNENNVQGIQNSDAKQYENNLPFKDGDFGDIKGLAFFRKPKFQYKDLSEHNPVNMTTNMKGENQITNSSSSGAMVPDLVTDGIYWSDYVESLVPKGLSYRNITKLLEFLRRQKVQYVKPPDWQHCGRPKNGYVVLEGGQNMCARYRHPHDELVYGETLSFYLSMLLGMDNVPAVVLSKVSSRSPKWRGVDFQPFNWTNGKTVALIQWINGMDSMRSRERMPGAILKSYNSQIPVSIQTLQNSPQFASSQLADLVQWGSLIIFDYLTGNYDRVASMQDAADHESKPSIIQENIRNLRKSLPMEKLWLIDNESGLLDGYQLLYSDISGIRFIKFHTQMLQTMCVFQKSLIQNLEKLYKSESPHRTLLEFAKLHEPLISHIPKDTIFKLFEKHFSDRLKEVYEWIMNCKKSSAR